MTHECPSPNPPARRVVPSFGIVPPREAAVQDRVDQALPTATGTGTGTAKISDNGADSDNHSGVNIHRSCAPGGQLTRKRVTVQMGSSEARLAS
jgi:hypothetical protein